MPRVKKIDTLSDEQRETIKKETMEKINELREEYTKDYPPHVKEAIKAYLLKLYVKYDILHNESLGA